VLNGLWLGFFVVGAAAGLIQWLMLGDTEVFSRMVASLFDMAKLSVDVMILLFGTLTLWLGLLRIAEQAGLVNTLGRWLAPLFARLMPGVPRGHPALGLITMNFAANGLGLDNAATPVGLKAMRELQTLNPNPNVATDAQILFLVLNTSSLTLLPVTIFMYRLQQGAPESDPGIPTDSAGHRCLHPGWILAVSWMQRLPLRDPVVLLWLGATVLLLSGIMAATATMTSVAVSQVSSLTGNLVLLGIILLFLVLGAWRKVPVYESFIDGAKQGFEIAKDLLPYLVAMLCAIGLLRASGAMDFALDAIRWTVELVGGDTRFIDALPTAMVKPLSGSAARAMMIETMQFNGVDSFAGLLAATLQGSTETTFYVLAVYFGAVGIQRARHAVGCALLADLAGIVTAIVVCYIFFGAL